MFDKKVISEIEDWNHIDYICIKSKKTGIHTDVYYLDGHTVFEQRMIGSLLILHIILTVMVCQKK